MRTRLSVICSFIAAVCFAQTASADVIQANPTSNNGGSANWAIFSDFASLGSELTVTDMTTHSTAAAGAAFDVEVFIRDGSGLGGPVGSGPGSSPAGWTSLGVAAATQGADAGGESLLIDIPDFTIGAGQTVGVAFLFTGAGPRYFGTGSPPYETFADSNISVTTGDSRSAPFTTGGSFFSSRGHAGSFTYSVVPEPSSMAIVGLAMLGFCGLRRRK